MHMKTVSAGHTVNLCYDLTGLKLSHHIGESLTAAFYLEIAGNGPAYLLRINYGSVFFNHTRFLQCLYTGTCRNP